MSETLWDRIKEILVNKQMSETLFERKCGLSGGTMNRVKNGKGMAIDSISGILCTFPDIDAYWLITGQKDPKLSGEAKNGTTAPQNPQTAQNRLEIESFYQEQLRQKDAMINRLLGLLEKGENKVYQSVSYGND